MTGDANVQALFNSEYLIMEEDRYFLKDDSPEWAKEAFENIQAAFQKLYGGEHHA